MKEHECCICGRQFTEFGNNPYPVRAEGQCCDECNMQIVVPARICMIYAPKEEQVADATRALQGMSYAGLKEVFLAKRA